ncbi:hypothetical protein Gotur_020034 [Gossypium turneri]
MFRMYLLHILMKKETNSMTAKLMSLWMTWMFLLRNRNQIETKGFNKSQKNSRSSKKKAINLYPTLCEIEGLTVDECYRALSKISDHLTQMLVFFSLPSDVRLEWIRRFLADH